MSSSSWNGQTGLWTTATLWSAGVPTNAMEADFGGTSADSVTYTGTGTVAGIVATDSLVIFDMASGVLAAGAWDWGGAFAQSGGTLSLAGENPIFAGPATQSSGMLILSSAAGFDARFADGLRQSSGLIELDAGRLTLLGASTLGGTLTGRGTLLVGGADAVTFTPGATIGIGHLDVAAGGLLAFGSNASAFTVLGDLDLAAGAALSAPNEMVTLAAGGAGTLAGSVTVAQLGIAGAYDLSGVSLAGAGSVLVTGSAALDADPDSLGASGTLISMPGGALTLLDPGTLAGSFNAFVGLGGTLDQPGPGTFVIAVPSLVLGGGADITGALDLAGGQASLRGSVAGTGTLALVDGETGVLAAGMLGEAGLAIAAGATLDITNATSFAGTLAAAGVIETGAPFTLGPTATGTLAGAVTGGGTLDLAGEVAWAADVLSATLLITGVAAAAPGAAIGTGGALSIAASGTLDLTGAGTLAAASLVNDGLLRASAPAALTGNITTAGTLDIDAGALTLAAGSAMLDGLIEGAGTLALADMATLGAQALVEVAHLALAGGTLSLGENLALYAALSGAGTIDTNGFALNLQTGQVAGLITGGGAVQTAGPVDEGVGAGITLQGNATTLLDNLMFTADGAGLVLDSFTTFQIATGATFSITDAATITGGTGAAFTNAGTLTVAQTDPRGPGATIALATLTNTGTIADNVGALTIAAALINTGVIEASGALNVTGAIAGTGDLLIATGATLRLGAAVGAGAKINFFGESSTLVLGDAAGFAGTIENFGAGEAIDLAGLAATSLTYAGNTLTLFGVTAGVTTALASLDASGLTGPSLALVADGAGGVVVLDDPAGHVNAPPGASFATAAWNQPETGNASAADNWLSGTIPAVGALLVFGSAANPYEAVFDETFTAYGITAGAGATLALTGGSLAVTNTLSAGTVTITAGTLDAVANPAGNDIATLSLGGLGALEADAGALTIGTALGTLAGTLEGAGEIVLAGADILGGVDLLAATIALAGTASLAGNLIDFESASFINDGVLSLGTYDLLLGFLTADELAGQIIGSGTVTAAGVGTLDGILSATLLDLGVLQGGGSESLTGAISIAAGALLVDAVITGGTGTLANAGELSAGDGTQTLALGQFTNTGTIAIEDGTLALDAASAWFAGLVTGEGVLALTGGVTTLAPGLSFSASTLALTAAATLSAASSLALAAALIDTGGLLEAVALTLTGSENMLEGQLAGTLALGGGTLAGLTLTGSGTSLLVGGNAQLNGAGLSLAATTGLSLASGATLALAGPLGGAGTLNNAGLLLDAGLTPVSLAPGTFDNTGTLAIGANGVVTLATGGTLDGAIAGAGTLLLSATSPLTLAAGLVLGGANLTLAGGDILAAGPQTIAGDFALAGATLDLAGQALDLAGNASLAGTLAGAGDFTIAGDVLAGSLDIADGAQIFITGTLAAAGSLADAGFIGIAPGGTLDLVASAPFGGTGATLLNDGLLEKTADGLTSILTEATVVNNGTIDDAFGTIAIAGTLINDGTLIEAGLGGLIAGALIGDGDAVIDPAGLTVSGAVAAGETIAFTGPGGTLTLDDPADFAGTIAGTLNGDVILLPGLDPASVTASTLANSILTLSTGAGSLTFGLADAANFTQPLIIGTDGGMGSEVTMACFAAGTCLATPGGPRKVEDLQPGDLVLTAGPAGPSAAPIIWTGKRRLELCRHPQAAALRPIRIIAGAFGPGLPARDLRLSPNHAVFMGNVLIEAAALVNGATIRREHDTPVVTYHHIELATHNLLLAENLPVESYRDTGSRADFTHTSGTASTAQPPCAPLCRGGPALAAARAQLLARAPTLGFTRTTSPHLTARAATRRLRPLPHPHAYQFALPPALTHIELLSPAARPTDLSAIPADPRTLGAALASVTLQTPTQPIQINLADHAHTGLYDCEPTLCWTNGHATLTLPPYRSPALLAVRLAGAVERWVGAL